MSIGEDKGLVELHSNPSFWPKVITFSFRLRVIRLRAFFPSPHANREEEGLVSSRSLPSRGIASLMALQGYIGG